MRKYDQLAIEQRYQIYAFRKAGMSLKGIADEIGKDKSTVSRELRRNKGLRGYRPDQANRLAKERKKNARKSEKMTSYAKFMIAEKIRLDWSPEQISGYFKRHQILDISHQSIYTLIKENHKSGGTLYKHLRRSSKKRKKRYGSTDSRGQIKNRIMIDARPKIVEEKSRIGDWEVDTMIGSHHKGAIVTVVERKSKYIMACPVSDKSEKVVTKVLIGLLKPYQKKVHTITGDNGKEFAGHEKIAKNLKANFYFAHPYSSWERGLNENSNGLLRQYYPKKTDLRDVDRASIGPVLEKINNRPRKTLDYATPKEVFFGLINNDNLQYQKVALAT
jgi:IS30 family transposase